MPPSKSQSRSPIPLIYAILFTYIDPIFCLTGSYLHLFSQPTALAGYSPTAPTISLANTRTTTTVPLLLENLAGFFLVLGVLEATLLRIRPDDIAVWRTVQASILILDVVMVWTHSKALTIEGRWDVGQWRGDDWRNIAGNACIGFARLCCALGMGMGGLGGIKGKVS